MESHSGIDTPILEFAAAVFDLDGVVTRTATVHATAWKQLFDDFLTRWAERTGDPFAPFDAAEDYYRYVDGKPRYDGVRSFLAARAIELPEGAPDDPPDRETVCGLGNRKDGFFLERLHRDGVEVFESTVELIRRLRAAGVHTALVSSSNNAAEVLAAAGLSELFDVRVDGIDAARLGLAGKPSPDLFRHAAEALGAVPGQAVAVEDALSGVAAARAAGYALVIGVDRNDQSAALRQHGADVVVSDLAEVPWAGAVVAPLPDAIEAHRALERQLGGKRLSVFLDYDGTLSPIVADPRKAALDEAVRETIRTLARQCTVAIVSGRDRADVEQLVGLDELIYAGSHGFDIAGPGGLHKEHERAPEFLPALDRAERRLHDALDAVDGVLIERKRFAIAAHYRRVAAEDVARVQAAVDAAVAETPEALRKTGGKMVFELRPRVDWDKGRAVLWLLTALELNQPDVVPLYIGDDETDEDAFVALREAGGIGVVVSPRTKRTAADYRVDDTAAVGHLLQLLAQGKARQ